MLGAGEGDGMQQDTLSLAFTVSSVMGIASQVPPFSHDKQALLIRLSPTTKPPDMRK